MCSLEGRSSSDLPAERLSFALSPRHRASRPPLKPDGSCLTWENDMAENDRARLLTSYDDQLAELRRYL
jgi:hypothetical protein